jgi:hypothetical protein
MTPKKPPTTKEDSKALNVVRRPDETPADGLAHTALRPTVQAAITLMEYNKSFGELSINTLVDDLGKQCRSASSGDLSRAEALLTVQAHTLDAIFNNLARRAAMNMGEYINAAETYMRLALKAQSQCCRTLETLAAIKHPPASVAFVRQANIAHGPQQVNNGAHSSANEPSRAWESQKPPNKLLEQADGERLDVGAPATASGADKELATVGTIDGTANGSG